MDRGVRPVLAASLSQLYHLVMKSIIKCFPQFLFLSYQLQALSLQCRNLIGLDQFLCLQLV